MGPTLSSSSLLLAQSNSPLPEAGCRVEPVVALHPIAGVCFFRHDGPPVKTPPINGSCALIPDLGAMLAPQLSLASQSRTSGNELGRKWMHGIRGVFKVINLMKRVRIGGFFIHPVHL
jgi:hypothetical protein